MTTQTIEVQSGDQPDAAVIWLHGLGADGSDFEPIVPALGLPSALAVRFVFPNAPIRPVTINGGMQMPAWYDILALGGKSEDESGIRQSQETLQALIAREQERGIGTDRIALAGFSQGGAVALQTGLRHGDKLAGIMALSTYLPLAASLPEEKSTANAQIPILMVHGTQDPMIPIERAQKSRELIEQAGFAVNWHEFAMAHEVCMPEIQVIGQWLQEIF